MRSKSRARNKPAVPANGIGSNYNNDNGTLKPKLTLSNLSCTLVYFENTSLNVPLFLVDAFNKVTGNIRTEGLFRKSGNMQRIKNAKNPFFGDFYISESLNAYDVCSLIKQFFRDIEEPLFTYELEPQFFKYRCLQRESTRVKYLLELCHVLRPIHRETVAFLMRKLRQVTQYADHNKMDSYNLASVIWPSLFRVPCAKTDLGVAPNQRNRDYGSVAVLEKREAELKCALLQTLIENADEIGILSTYEKVMSPDMYDCLLPEDIIVTQSRKRCRITRHNQRPTVLCLCECDEFKTPQVDGTKRALRSDEGTGTSKKSCCRPKKYIAPSNLIDKSTIELKSDSDEKESSEKFTTVKPMRFTRTYSRSINNAAAAAANHATTTDDVIARVTRNDDVIAKPEDLVQLEIESNPPSDTLSTSGSHDLLPSISCLSVSARQPSVESVATNDITDGTRTEKSVTEEHLKRAESKSPTLKLTPVSVCLTPISETPKTYVVSRRQSKNAIQLQGQSENEEQQGQPENVGQQGQSKNEVKSQSDMGDTDFENSQARKHLITQQVDNPFESTTANADTFDCTKMTPAINLRSTARRLMNHEDSAIAGVRPSVAYILKARRGIVKGNKALFEEKFKPSDQRKRFA